MMPFFKMKAKVTNIYCGELRTKQHLSGCNTPREGKEQLKVSTRIEDPQILDATIENLVAMATWHGGFVHPCLRIYLNM
jgi:hypothetical protein